LSLHEDVRGEKEEFNHGGHGGTWRREREGRREEGGGRRPFVVLGGPEVSYLPDDAEIFRFADYVIRGEGESVFSALCESILQNENKMIGGCTQSSDGDIWLDRPYGHAKACVNSCQPSGASRGLRTPTKELIFNMQDNLAEIKTGYHLYTDEDVARKLVYVESSRGCPFECEFCLSAIKHGEHNSAIESEERGGTVMLKGSVVKTREHNSAVKPREHNNMVREFPLEPFLTDMEILINRGVRTIKFLDRTFNANTKRAVKICEFFLRKLEERERAGGAPFVVHFEMVPSLFPRELCDILARFPPGSLRLEIGVQTLNTEVSARIHRPGWQNQSIDTEKELETLRFLRKNTNAIIHVDLIAGLPGEDLLSFGRGFDRLWGAVCGEREEGEGRREKGGEDREKGGRGKYLTTEDTEVHGGGRREERDKRGEKKSGVEIQVGILKLLPGAGISRFNLGFGMRYNCRPPYEIEETSVISEGDLLRLKNFAAFWERLVNRGFLSLESGPVFDKFMALSDALFAHFGKNWGIDRGELIKKVVNLFAF